MVFSLSNSANERNCEVIICATAALSSGPTAGKAPYPDLEMTETITDILQINKCDFEVVSTIEYGQLRIRPAC